MGIIPQAERSLVRLPVRTRAWAAGQVSGGGAQDATDPRFSHTLVFLSLSPRFPSL